MVYGKGFQGKRNTENFYGKEFKDSRRDKDNKGKRACTSIVFSQNNREKVQVGF